MRNVSASAIMPLGLLPVITALWSVLISRPNPIQVGILPVWDWDEAEFVRAVLSGHSLA